MITKNDDFMEKARGDLESQIQLGQGHVADSEMEIERRSSGHHITMAQTARYV